MSKNKTGASVKDRSKRGLSIFQHWEFDRCELHEQMCCLKWSRFTDLPPDAVMWCVMFWQRVKQCNSLSTFAEDYFCLHIRQFPSCALIGPPAYWKAEDVTHLSRRVSHCRSWDGKGQDLLGMWTVSPWLTPALITIHHWEQAYSQAYGFSRAALSLMVKWIIRPWHIRVLIINMRHADWKNHSHFAVWIS